MTSKSKEWLRKEYTGRINNAMIYIEENLDKPLKVKDIAAAANFSRYHFSRLFSAFTGESLMAFVRRKRIEKAGAMLISLESKPISEIAEECGFSSHQLFSRIFSENFNMSPTDFRDGGYKVISKKNKTKSTESKTESKNNEVGADDPFYFRNEPNQQNVKIMKVEVKELKEMTAACVRHTGSYSKMENAFETLMRWAGPRGLITEGCKMLALYHDDPNLTQEDQLHSSACLLVPENTKVSGEISKITIEGGNYACGRFEIDETGFGQAWEKMMGEWLPESGYVCADRLPFELYHNNHEEHPERKFILDICIPVKPM